jgi:WD40 repeat protein
MRLWGLGIGLFCASAGLIFVTVWAAKSILGGPDERDQNAPQHKVAPNEKAVPKTRKIKITSGPLPQGAIGRLAVGSSIASIAYAPDCRRLAIAESHHTVHLVELPKVKPLEVLEGHKGEMVAIAFSPDSKKLASVGSDGLRIWETENGRPIQLMQNPRFISVVYSPDGRKLVLAGDGRVEFYDATTHKLLQLVEGYGDNLKYSPNGKILGATSLEKIVMWDASSGNKLRVCQGPDNKWGVGSFAFAPNSETLATVHGDNVLRIWDTSTVKALHVLKGLADCRIAYSPDGKVLVAGGEGYTLRIWEVATGKLLRSCSGHLGLPEQLDFTPDGKILVSKGRDKCVRLWDPETGKMLHVCEGHNLPIDHLVMAPDGKTFVSSDWGGDVIVWEIATLVAKDVK